MFCSILIWSISSTSTNTLGNTDNWYRIVLVIFSSFAGLWVLMRNARNYHDVVTIPLFLLLLYGLVALISSIYIPEHSFYSMWKALEIIIDVFLAVSIISYVRQNESAWLAYRLIIYIFCIMLLVYWIEAILLPKTGFVPSRGYLPFTMTGILPTYNGNSLAFLSAVVAFAFICRFFRLSQPGSKIKYLFIIGLALLTLILAQSRTSLVGFFVALMVYLFYDRRIMLLLFFIMSGLVVSLFFAGFTDVFYQYFMRGQSDELFLSLSGRTAAWVPAWELFMESPILGHGFAAAARVNVLGVTGASTLHGSIFDVIVGVGVLGFIPWAMALVLVSFRLISLSHNNHAWFDTVVGRSMQAEMLGMLTLIIIRSITSSGLAMHEHTFMLFLAVLMYVETMRNAIQRSDA